MHVLIIGAGLMGTTTAYFLRQHGIDVTVLEKEPGAALGASYGNGGYIQASAPEPWNMPGILGVFAQAWLAGLTGKAEKSAFVTRTTALPGLIGWGIKFLRHANTSDYLANTVKNMRLASYSRETIQELNRTEDLSYAHSAKGALFLFRSEESLQAYMSLANHVKKRGARVELLDRDALIAKEPSLTDIGDRLVGAVYYPDDEAGNSRQFCEQIAEISARNGAGFVYGSQVQDIATSADGVSVRTDDERISADALVIAAGAFSPKIARQLAIRLPVAPAKGYSISIPMRDWSNRPTHVLADMGVHAGINPMGDILRVAGTAEFAGLNQGVSDERTSYLIDLTRQIFPGFAEEIDRHEIDPWGGLRPLSADGLPMIGPTSMPGVYVNTGHGGLGMTQAAGSSRALADLIAGATNAFDLADFSLERFN